MRTADGFVFVVQGFVAKGELCRLFEISGSDPLSSSVFIRVHLWFPSLFLRFAPFALVRTDPAMTHRRS
jgi:hypothetical protein